MQAVIVVKLLVLLMMANGTPVILKRVLGARFARPLDFGRRWPDGRPVLGPSKTWRGLAGAFAVTGFVAALLGFGWQIGLVIAGFAMLGDLVSSFVKRRLGLASGGKALGLDQIPESLFPLLAVSGALDLGAWDVAAGVAGFFVGELLLSRILFRLKLRDQPY